MRKGEFEIRLPSPNIAPETNSSIYTDKASSQTDMERMENPFRNLHPKIYYRQKNVPSRRMFFDNKREFTMDFQSSPLLSVNLKMDHPTKHSKTCWPIKENGYSVTRDKTVRGKGCVEFEEGRRNQNKIAYFNKRNISLSKDASEGQKLALPFLVFPKATRETGDENLINTSIRPSGKNNKGLFPPIKNVPSFIPLEAEQKMKRKKLRKNVRDTQAARINKQKGEYQWNTYATAVYPALPSLRDDHAEHTIQRQYSQVHGNAMESDTGKKGRGSLGVSKTTNFSCTNSEDFNSRIHVTSQGISARTHSNHNAEEEINSDYIILKAKIHRSSFL